MGARAGGLAWGGKAAYVVRRNVYCSSSASATRPASATTAAPASRRSVGGRARADSGGGRAKRARRVDGLGRGSGVHTTKHTARRARAVRAPPLPVATRASRSAACHSPAEPWADGARAGLAGAVGAGLRRTLMATCCSSTTCTWHLAGDVLVCRVEHVGAPLRRYGTLGCLTRVRPARPRSGQSARPCRRAATIARKQARAAAKGGGWLMAEVRSAKSFRGCPCGH